MVIILVSKGCKTFGHEYHLERFPVGFDLSAVAMEIIFCNLSDNHSRMSLFEISQRPFLQCYSIGTLCTLLAATSQLYGSASKWSSLIHHSWFILVLLSESVCRVWAKSFIRHLVS